MSRNDKLTMVPVGMFLAMFAGAIFTAFDTLNAQRLADGIVIVFLLQLLVWKASQKASHLLKLLFLGTAVFSILGTANFLMTLVFNHRL